MDKLYKIIVINLDRDKDRMNFMKKQLDREKLKYTRSAINGKEYLKNGGGDEFDATIAGESGMYKMSAGMIGCALSHKRCYQKFLTDKKYKDTKYLLILEDDIEIPTRFKKTLERVIRENEENKKFDYLQFSYPHPNSFKEISILRQYKNQIASFKSATGFTNKLKRFPFLLFMPFFSCLIEFRILIMQRKEKINNPWPKIPALTSAYLINKEVARAFIPITEKIIYVPDVATDKCYQKNKHRLKFRLFSPVLELTESGMNRSSTKNIPENN